MQDSGAASLWTFNSQTMPWLMFRSNIQYFCWQLIGENKSQGQAWTPIKQKNNNLPSRRGSECYKQEYSLTH